MVERESRAIGPTEGLLLLLGLVMSVAVFWATRAPDADDDARARGLVPSVPASAGAIGGGPESRGARDGEAARTAAASAFGGVEWLAHGDRQRPVMPGEVLLTFGEGTTHDAAAEQLSAHGLRLMRWSASTHTARAALPEGMSVAEGLGVLGAASGLPRPWPNAVAWAAKKKKKDEPAPEPEPEAAPEPEPEPEPAPAPEPEVEESGNGALKAQKGSAHLPIVAVLDTGVAYKNDNGAGHVMHPDFDGVQIVEGRDFVNDDAHALDDHQHGTHMATVMLKAAKKLVKIMPVKVLDADARGNEFDIAAGIDFAVENGADVINMSLTFGPVYLPSPAMRQALEAADEANVVLVAAAGNSGSSMVEYPAALRNVLAVGSVATDDLGNSWAPDYASTGAGLDCVAKGGGDDQATEGIESGTIELNRPDRIADVPLSGTSVASAFAAGVASQAVHHRDGLTATEFKALFTAKLRDLDEPYDPAMGVGRVKSTFHIEDGVDGLAVIHEETTYASLNVFLERTNGQRMRAVGLVELTDAERSPIADATVYVDWMGSFSGPATCRTDVLGRCVLSTDSVRFGAVEPVLVAGRASRVLRADGRLSEPQASYRIGEDRATAYQASVEEQELDRRGRVRDTTYRAQRPVLHFAGGEPAEESLLSGRDLAPSWMYRDLNGPGVGAGLVLAFDATYRASLPEDAVVELPDAVRLLCNGPADPLVWVNDCDEETLAHGAGLMGSGWVPNGRFSLSFWSFSRAYLAGGAGLMGSGWVDNNWSPRTWSFSRFFASGAGLMGSGWVIGGYANTQFQALNSGYFGARWSAFGAGLSATEYSPFDLLGAALDAP